MQDNACQQWKRAKVDCTQDRVPTNHRATKERVHSAQSDKTW